MKKFMTVLTALAIATAFTTATFGEDAGAKPEKPGKVKVEKMNAFTGQITKIDATAGSVEVKNDKDETKTFKTDAKTKISATDKKEATLADLKVGDKVAVLSTAAEADLAKTIRPFVKRVKAGGENKKKSQE